MQVGVVQLGTACTVCTQTPHWQGYVTVLEGPGNQQFCLAKQRKA